MRDCWAHISKATLWTVCITEITYNACQQENYSGMTLCRSQHQYPTTAADYELEKEVGKGACGMVSA